MIYHAGLLRIHSQARDDDSTITQALTGFGFRIMRPSKWIPYPFFRQATTSAIGLEGDKKRGSVLLSKQENKKINVLISIGLLDSRFVGH